MANQKEHLQQLWHRYEREHNFEATGAKEVVDWAVKQGLLALPIIDPRDILAGKMADALRDEMATASDGRRYRKNHAIRVSKNGVQTTMWAMMSHAPETHMRKAFSQRREQIIGDCLQLKTDVDVYNDMNSGKQKAIQLSLDFTDDVAEREVQSGMSEAA